jgi:transaldolase
MFLWVHVHGVRGVTANPTTLAKAMESSDAYDDQLARLRADGRSSREAFWDLAITDISDALDVLKETFDASAGTDGFVSIEVDPGLYRSTDGTIAMARDLHERVPGRISWSRFRLPRKACPRSRRWSPRAAASTSR